MKIAITTDSYFPRLGGQEMATFRLAGYLRRDGHEVTIFTTEKHPWDGPEEGGLEVIRAAHRFRLADGARLRSRLERLFQDADVVHAQYCYRLAALGLPIARRLGRRFVVTLHGMGLLDNPRDNLLRRWSHRRYRRQSIAGADAVIATSSDFARLASGYASPSRIHLIPNAVDSERFDPEIPVPADLAARFHGSEVVLAVSRLVPVKGIQYLVQAAPEILRRRPNARFVIGGWGTLEERLKRMARDLGVEANFDFVGAIPNHLVPGYLALARVVVIPSSSESTSLTCLEAMAMRRPVVASALGGLAELLADPGRGVLVDLFGERGISYDAPPLLPPERASRLAAAVAGVLEDPAGATRMGEAAREFALKYYDWSVAIRRIVAIYRGEADGTRGAGR